MKTQPFLESIKKTKMLSATTAKRSTEETWNSVHDSIYNSAIQTYDKRERRSTDLFEASASTVEPAVAAKRAAILNHKKRSCNTNVYILQQVKRKA